MARSLSRLLHCRYLESITNVVSSSQAIYVWSLFFQGAALFPPIKRYIDCFVLAGDGGRSVHEYTKVDIWEELLRSQLMEKSE